MKLLENYSPRKYLSNGHIIFVIAMIFKHDISSISKKGKTLGFAPQPPWQPMKKRDFSKLALTTHFSPGDCSLFLGKLRLFFLFYMPKTPTNSTQKKFKESRERIFGKIHFLFFSNWWLLPKVEKSEKLHILAFLWPKIVQTSKN